MPSLNARGHSVPFWEDITPATGAEVGSVVGHRPVGVGQYTESISRDVADIVLLDMQIEEWLDNGIISAGNAALAQYRNERAASGR
jgi:hypothetical protein